MPKSVSEKMGVKEGMRTFLHQAPAATVKEMSLPNIEITAELAGQYDYIHFFTTSQSELDLLLPNFQACLKPRGMLWVSWPKGRGLGTDLVLPRVIQIGYNHGLVESICLSVDAVWSGLKFTHPQPGKTYHNSYGQLPAQEPEPLEDNPAEN